MDHWSDPIWHICSHDHWSDPVCSHDQAHADHRWGAGPRHEDPSKESKKLEVYYNKTGGVAQISLCSVEPLLGEPFISRQLAASHFHREVCLV